MGDEEQTVEDTPTEPTEATPVEPVEDTPQA